jgi:CheY-like chemotaxis protein/nitrogen-specific signal transduction histidine kinase
VTLDITERKEADARRQQMLDAERRARAAAERNSRMKDEFLATLSHELRTPLNAILGWAQILRSGAADEGDLAEGLEAIERNARAQTQLIGDLLDMSRIISGKIKLERQPVDLVGMIAAAIETIRPAADAKQIQVRPVLNLPAAIALGDPHRLQQVLWNLLTNSVKFTPAGGIVRIVLSGSGSTARVAVIDSGEGIAADFLPYVFARFRQADAAPSRRFGGLGLGLAIARHLVEIHGGSISAHSDGPGTGATFTMALPLSESAAPITPATGNAAPAPRLGRVNVLVVDDEPDARHLVRRVLEGAEARVVTAGSAAEAFIELDRGAIDILICDLGMPEVDGYALIRKLRLDASSPARSIPAVALTAYARGEEQHKALESGFQVHIAKPFSAIELVNTVAALTVNTSAGE